jgi:hypothetical protein
MNPLKEYPAVRRALYQAHWVAVAVLGGVQVWYATTGSDAPSWLPPALAVAAYVGGVLSTQASVNVPGPAHKDIGEAL